MAKKLAGIIEFFKNLVAPEEGVYSADINEKLEEVYGAQGNRVGELEDELLKSDLKQYNSKNFKNKVKATPGIKKTETTKPRANEKDYEREI